MGQAQKNKIKIIKQIDLTHHFNEDVLYLFKIFENIGANLWVVGGAVRDILLGKEFSDVDFVTDIDSEKIQKQLSSNGRFSLIDYAKKYGCITFKSKTNNYHVTSMREDVKSYGRNADTRHTKDILIDGLQSGTSSRTEQFWLMRESITYASAKDGPQVKHDISIPISKIPKFVDSISKKINELFPNTRIINFGHLGDGNLHFNIAPPDLLGSEINEEKRKKAFKNYLLEHEDMIRKCVHDEVILHEGSISAEHGLGQLRKNEAARLKSPIELKMMQKIKKIFDPSNIMNPGKVL